MTTIAAENAKQIRRSMDVLIQITPQTGDPIIINNDSLIRAVVSLRSDLSILEPTLPESEINIEAYFDTDISDILASIPDETPVTYQAGYEGDMSPVRKFYLAEQITWADNIMSVHAVDAVHLLDKETETATMVAQGSILSSNLSALLLFAEHLIVSAGVECSGITYRRVDTYDNIARQFVDTQQLVFRQRSRRDILAYLMNLMRMEFDAGYLMDGDSIWINYVDAGIPKFTSTKPSALYDIYESDCGDVSRHTERKITKLNLTRGKANKSSPYGGFRDREEVGSGTWFYQSGIALDISSDYVLTYGPGYFEDGAAHPSTLESVYEGGSDATSDEMQIWTLRPDITATFGFYLLHGELKEGIVKKLSGEKLYTQFIPWTTQQNTVWSNNGLSTSNASYPIQLHGSALTEELVERSFGSSGYSIDVKDEMCFGTLYTRGGSTSGSKIIVWPNRAYNSLLQRSNITGSFTWKGDPRMQPRDVFTFHRLDGTDEVCTLENITITHEKGGTSAEITYRKGIC